MSARFGSPADFLDLLFGKQPPDAIEGAFWKLRHATPPLLRLLWLSEFLQENAIVPQRVIEIDQRWLRR